MHISNKLSTPLYRSSRADLLILRQNITLCPRMCVPEPRLTYHHYIIGDVEHEAIIYSLFGRSYRIVDYLLLAGLV